MASAATHTLSRDEVLDVLNGGRLRGSRRVGARLSAVLGRTYECGWTAGVEHVWRARRTRTVFISVGSTSKPSGLPRA